MLKNPYHFQEFLKNKLFDNSKKLLGLNHKAVIFLFKQLEHFLLSPERRRLAAEATICRSKAAVRRCSSKWVLLKNSGLQTCNFIKKRPQHRCFPVNIVKFFRTPFLYTPS